MQQHFVDGRYRAQNTSSSDFAVELSRQVNGTGRSKQRRFRVDFLRVPNVFPTTYPPANKLRFFMGDNDQSYDATLPVTNFSSLAEFAAAIATAMTNTSPLSTVNVDTPRPTDYDQFRITLTSVTNFRIDGTYGLGAQLLSSPLYVHPPSTFQDPAVKAPSFTFTNVTLRGPEVLYLSSSTLNKDSSGTMGPLNSTDTLMQINVTEPYGAVIERSMPTDVWLPLSQQNTRQVEFTLRDRNYQPLEMSPSFSLVLTTSP
jgi:hypothetical protein